MVAPYVPIQDIVPWTQSIAGLNQFIYSTNWTANDASDILVYARLPNIPASDMLQLVDSSNYTVEFIGASNVVQVTFLPLNNPPQYSIITIMRNQPSSFLNLYTNTNFTPSMLNSDFENLVQVDQQNQLYWQQIVPRYNNSATVNVPIDTILPVLKANEFWIKNSTNTAFIAATIGDSGEFPVLGPFVLYSANSNYPDGFDLGSLASGILAQNSALDIATPYIIPIPMSVPNGGTGLDSITPFAVLTGGATDELPIVPIADLGDEGEVFTSAGPGMPPSWQPIPSLYNYITSQTPTQIALTSGVVSDLASVTLPAGIWNVWGSILYSPNSSTTMNVVRGWTNTVSGTYPGAVNTSIWDYTAPVSAPLAGTQITPINIQNLVLNTTTTVYISALVTFAVSTLNAFGIIAAQRVA